MAESIDHRAEAEYQLARIADGQIAELEEINVALAMALVHATLAAGTPVADEHVREALAETKCLLHFAATKHDELRAAVRELLDELNHHPAVEFREVLPTERAALRKLVG